jgi:predicted P-loop ATPase
MVYTATTHLKPEHQKHLLDEGFTLEQIAEWEKLGLRSIDKEEAEKLNLKYWTEDGWKCGEGLYFPFTESFGQIRLDVPVVRSNGSTAKYLTPYGAKSEAWIPDGSNVITEGPKDAHAGTVHGGILTGAIAGISHYRRALKQGAKNTTLFDADGWNNPSVLSNLFHAGKWLNGKVQLLPEIPDEPKAGLCEYFKWLEHLAKQKGIEDIAAFKRQEYQKLINSAMTPEDLLFQWAERFKGIPSKKLSQALRVAFKLAASYLERHEQNRLLNILTKKTQYTKKDLQILLRKAIAKQKRIQAREIKQRIKEQAATERRFDEVWAKMNRALEIAQQKVPPSEEELDEIWEYLESRPNSLEKQVAQQGIREKWGSILFPESRYKQAAKAIKKLYGGRLRFNTLKQQIEFSDEPLDLDFVRHEICSALDKDIPQSDITDILLGLANQRRYCPVAGYLERVAQTYANDDLDLDTLADILFVLQKPREQNKRLARAYFKRHLIASVARAFRPGCKVDTALILQGLQGILKSAFFGILYRQDLGWFDDSMTESGDKDELLKLHQHWCVEWAEFERTLGRKGNSKIKGFMTTKVDNFRPPYGRQTKAFPRRGVLVGSTNEQEFLTDATGDRRFWIIAVESLNLKLAEELRDRIWAAAVKAYRAGEQWWLTREEAVLHDEANQPFRMSDPWETPIQAYLNEHHLDRVTVSELLTRATELEVSRQTRGDEMRVTGILKQMGWNKSDKRVTINGVKRYVWVAPNEPTNPPTNPIDQPDQPFIEVSPEVGQGSSDAISVVPEPIDQPDQPFCPTFRETEPKNVKSSEEGANFYSQFPESLEKGWSSGGNEQASNSDISTVVTIDQPLVTNLEPDCSTFPHLTCDTLEAKSNQAEKIKQRLLDATSREELSAIKQEFSDRFKWVWKHLLTDAERGKLKAIAETKQLSLLEAAPSTTISDALTQYSTVQREEQPLTIEQTAPTSSDESDVTAIAVTSQSGLELVYEETQTPALTANDDKLYRVWSEHYGRTFEGCTLVKTTEGLISQWTFRTQEGELIRVYDRKDIEQMS